MIDSKRLYKVVLDSISNTAKLRGRVLQKSFIDEMARNAAACVIAELPNAETTEMGGKVVGCGYCTMTFNDDWEHGESADTILMRHQKIVHGCG